MILEISELLLNHIITHNITDPNNSHLFTLKTYLPHLHNIITSSPSRAAAAQSIISTLQYHLEEGAYPL